MNRQSTPFVTVLTPVYNGAAYLAECIESVLAQSYTNFEYIIVNNRSTDATLQVAQEYAARDPRIRVHDNETFVPVIENHNIAFGLMSPLAKYCKVVSGDDFIFPTCIEQQVRLAEQHPSVGLVGCYQLSGSVVRWQGFHYPQAVVRGRDLCREVFLRRDPSFGFGSPTSLMYRADLVRRQREFYPDPSPHSDTSACFRMLRDTDFGFVYDVISYERVHVETQSSASAGLNRYASQYINDLQRYGPWYLSETEYRRRHREEIADYDRFLAANLGRWRDPKFWNYHRDRRRELGCPIRLAAVLKAGAAHAVRHLFNPERAFRKVASRLSRRPAAA